MQVFFGTNDKIPGVNYDTNRVGNLWVTITPAYVENAKTYYRKALRWSDESYGNEFTIEELTNTSDSTDVIKRMKLKNSGDVQSYPVIWFRDAHYPVYSQPLPSSAIPVDGTSIVTNSAGKIELGNGVSTADLAALITYAKGQGWIQ